MQYVEHGDVLGTLLNMFKGAAVRGMRFCLISLFIVGSLVRVREGFSKNGTT
jgi:hypothetical protein